MGQKCYLLSCFQQFATPWTVACQASPSMGFPRQEYWCGLPFPSPGDLPDPGIEPRSSALQADPLLSEPPGMLLGAKRQEDNLLVGFQNELPCHTLLSDF